MNKISSSSKIQRLIKESRIYCQKNQFFEAKKIYQELIKIIPTHPEVLANLGTIEIQEGNIEVGIECLQKSIDVDSSQSFVLSNLANALLDTGKVSDALVYYDKALKLNPLSPELFYNKARALRVSKKYDEAIENYKKALIINPDYIAAISNLGFLFNELHEFDHALNEYNKALKIQSSNAEIYYNRGIVYENKKQYDAALEDYDTAININENFKGAYISRGNIKFILNDLNGAMHDYSYAIKLDPFAFEAIFNLSIIKLIQNNFIEGWKLYESRWEFKKSNNRFQSSKPELSSFDVLKKRIVIYPEQGIGDQILYSSLLHKAVKTDNYFYVLLDSRLINLYQRSFSSIKNIKFISSSQELHVTDYDFHLPIGGLCKFFIKSIQDFENHSKGFLKSDEKKVKELKQKITMPLKKICGISWLSKNQEIGFEKSMALEYLLPILSNSNTIFINLQYGDTKKETKNLLDKYNIELKSISDIDNFNDLDGLASIISACDYIITTSNVTAHLAGALNKKTYLMLPFIHGKIWYWGKSNEYSKWYPSVKILRSQDLNSWDSLMQDLQENLRENDD